MDDSLLIQYLKKQLKGVKQLQVEQWIDETPENKAYFNELKKLWATTGDIPELQNPNTDEAWLTLKSKIIQKKKVIHVPIIVKIAAAFVILVSAYFLLRYQTNVFVIEEWYTQISKDSIKKVVLADNTVIWLNRHSSIKWSNLYGKKLRAVTLQGEAFFDVTKNKDVPFMVNAGLSKIKVLGTSFNVEMNQFNHTKVALLTGKIELTNQNNAQKFILTPNQVADVDKNGSIAVNTNAYINDNAWLTGKLVFKNQTLEEITKVLNDYYKVFISFENDKLKDIRMSTSFSTNQNIKDVLNVLQETASFQIRKEKSGITIY